MACLSSLAMAVSGRLSGMATRLRGVGTSMVESFDQLSTRGTCFSRRHGRLVNQADVPSPEAIGNWQSFPNLAHDRANVRLWPRADVGDGPRPTQCGLPASDSGPELQFRLKPTVLVLV